MVVRKRIGTILVDKGYATKDQIKQALVMQFSPTEDRRLGEILVALGHVTEEQVQEGLAEQRRQEEAVARQQAQEV